MPGVTSGLSLLEVVAKAEQDYGIDCSHLKFNDKKPGTGDIVIYKLQNSKGELLWLISDVQPPVRRA